MNNMSYDIHLCTLEKTNMYCNRVICPDPGEYLKSTKYLEDIGKYGNARYLDLFYFYDGVTQLTNEEFKVFCDLYDEDLSKYKPEIWKRGEFINHPKIAKLIDINEDKIIYWE